MRTWRVALMCGLFSTGCVSGDPKDGGGGQQAQVGHYREVTGTVTPLVVTGVTAPAFDANFYVQFQDALVVPSYDTTHTLQGGNITIAGCTAQGCPLDVNGVRVDTATSGMWGLAYAFPVDKYPQWTISASKIATAAQVAAADNGNTTLTGIVAYALPTATLSKFASVSGLNATGSDSIQSRGAVIGVAQPNVTVAAQNASIVIYYPNDGFTGKNTSNTGSSGLFLAVGPSGAGSAISTPLTLTGTAGNANTWAGATLDLTPGIIAIEPYPSDQ